MNKLIDIALNSICPTPSTLRVDKSVDMPARNTSVNLGQLFLHYYFDSYPAAPPSPDPSRFEYLQLISSHEEFRFHAHVGDASTVKNCSLSAEIGQAFCRWFLQEHFGIRYFAHMNKVLDRSTHAAFEGLKIERIQRGDVPDYLCARKVTQPQFAEAKGRFSSIGFKTAEFVTWRDQFGRIRACDRNGMSRKLKGYIVATRFVTEAHRESVKSTIFAEDPETPGEAAFTDHDGYFLGRVAAAMHYARIFSKLDLAVLAAALDFGFTAAPELAFQVPVWTCMTPPLQGRQFIGGYYQTQAGAIPSLTEKGWRHRIELGSGHAVFVGLERNVARQVARAARGEWSALDTIPPLQPEGPWSSEFSWLQDGTVAGPVSFFLPTDTETI